ncbi:MAG: UDP-N-acetylglucosamine 2-epimerase (non-hydrolyzing) [Rhodothermaceae bacterium]|nr:UDP-N-acetylglucosamine 2-epimerase (non-hydrolyzing) [Rhodothermaceae bacterium]
MPFKIFNVVGARPNFMKIGPLHRAFSALDDVESVIVHTGQHYDERMSDIFFKQLELPKPDIYLGVGSGSHAQVTAKVMISFEEAVLEHKPDLILVVGDVNSTVACSIVAAKCHIPLAHVEAGLRSGDREMPEEINRLVTDSISDFLFVTEQSGLDNLKAEGVSDDKVFFVGNVMIDSLIHFREKAAQRPILSDLGVESKKYILMTMHRPANVDTPDQLERVVETIEGIAGLQSVVLPMHPRTRARLSSFGMLDRVEAIPGLVISEPLGYLDFLNLMDNAAMIVTDSGGIQEESTYLQVPCITLRDSTERPITVELGTNELMDLKPEAIVQRVTSVLSGDRSEGQIPPLWDGKAALRIAQTLEQLLMVTTV